MSSKKSSTTAAGRTIADNRKARHDYFIEEDLEAGLSLEGWEVKSLREKKIQLVDSYVLLKNGEAFLLGANITPLATAASHFVTDPTRTRKLLLNRRELNKLETAVNQKGHSCIPTALYWKGHLVKCEIALARGKDKHDKRETQKDRDWSRQKQRIMRHS